MPATTNALSNIRDGKAPFTRNEDQYAAAEQIARQMGIPVDQVLRGLQAQAQSGPIYTDNGEAGQTELASKYDEISAKAHQAALARANGIPAEGETFVNEISNPVSQLNSALPQYRGPYVLEQLRGHPKASLRMPDQPTLTALGAGTPRNGNPSPLASTVADAYAGIRNSRDSADANAADQREATQRALMASMGNNYAQLFDVYNPADLTAKRARHDSNNMAQRNALADMRMGFNSAEMNARTAESRSPLNVLSRLRDLLQAGLAAKAHDSMAGGRNLPPRPSDVAAVSAPRNF